MDPVTAVALAGNVLQLVELTAKVVKYGFEVAEADESKRKIKDELKSLHGLLKRLQQRCETAIARSQDESPAWLSGLWKRRGGHFIKDGVWVEGYTGPLFELGQAIGEAMIKINPSKDWKNNQAYMTFSKAWWPFKKQELEEIHKTI